MVNAKEAGGRYWADHVRDGDYTADLGEAFYEWVNVELDLCVVEAMSDHEYLTAWNEFAEAWRDARERTQLEDEEMAS